jgi:hypothetical protein
MSFDKFILAVESRDLSQADKSIIRVSSFPKLFLNDKTYGYTKKKIFCTLKFGKIDVQFYHSKICEIEKSTFFLGCLVRGKSERIESIQFAESSSLSC